MAKELRKHTSAPVHTVVYTHATIMLQQDVHLKIVQDRLGHSTIAITIDTYSHVLPGLQEAAALRFDEGFQSMPDYETIKQRPSAI